MLDGHMICEYVDQKGFAAVLTSTVSRCVPGMNLSITLVGKHGIYPAFESPQKDLCPLNIFKNSKQKEIKDPQDEREGELKQSKVKYNTQNWWKAK